MADVYDVASCFQKWELAGLKLPNYEFGMGGDYLEWLTGVPYTSNYRVQTADLNAVRPGLLDALAGPHGYAILMMLIAQREDANEHA